MIISKDSQSRELDPSRLFGYSQFAKVGDTGSDPGNLHSKIGDEAPPIPRVQEGGSESSIINLHSKVGQGET
tara:strand:- start:507 stop:722 length:216 start_codon:yes stop_codon:yes gene_type:complete